MATLGSYNTFSTLQKDGVARPAPIQYSNPLNQAVTQPMTTGTTGQQPASTTQVPQLPSSPPPVGPTPQLPPPNILPPATGGGTPAYNGPSGGGLGYPPPPNIENQLYNQWQQFQPLSAGSSQSLETLFNQMLQNPSAYGSEVVGNTYDMLNRRLSEGYDIERQKIDEEMSKRGLYNSTIAGGRYGDVAVQQARAQADLAQQLLDRQAQTYGADRSSALGLGFGAQQQGYGQQRGLLGDYLGYGQQAFENQMDTANFNQNQDQINNQLLIQLLGGL